MIISFCSGGVGIINKDIMNYENRSGGSSKFKESTSRKGLEGKANKAVVVSLAKFLKVKKSEIILIKGEKSKNKVFDFF